MLRSPVTRTSKRVAARRRSSPFERPAHPASGTVCASWPTRSGASWRGSDSSSSTRAIQEQITGKLENRNGLLARDGGVGIEKVLKAVAGTEELDEDADGDTSAVEDRRTAQDLGITANDIGNVGHLGHRIEYSTDRRLT